MNDTKSFKKIYPLEYPLDATDCGFSVEETLVEAMIQERVHIVNWLLEHGAPMTVKSRLFQGFPYTVLEIAVQHACLNSRLPLLLEKDLNSRNIWMRRPINLFVLALAKKKKKSWKLCQ
jgi:hypothetical protein